MVKQRCTDVLYEENENIDNIVKEEGKQTGCK